MFQFNKINFESLFKYISSLENVSLESSKKVVNLRVDIKNNIINLFNRLNEINLILDSAERNKSALFCLEKELQRNQENEVSQISYTVQEPYEEIVDKEIKCDSGLYVLYCNICNKVCHFYCKGPYEGWHSTEFGCNIIRTSGICVECSCNANSHKFKQSYIIKEKVIKYKNVLKYREDQNSVNYEKEKKYIREQINKQLEEINISILQYNNKIYCSFNELANLIYQLILKNNQLNFIALKKDSIKYEYIKDILKENVENKEYSKNIKIFNDMEKLNKECLDKNSILNLIQNIYSSNKLQ